MVEVQKPVFSDFQHALCGDRRGRGAKTHGFFCNFQHARATLCGDRRGRGAKTHGCFCDFCGARATLCGDRRGRGAKTRGFFAISAVLAQCKNSRFFATFIVRTSPRELSRGSRACSRNWRVAGSIPPWSAGGRRKMQLAFFKATCAEQLAQSNLHRATCADQLAPTSLRRAPCLEQLARSNLRRATCTEQLAQSSLHRATCREAVILVAAKLQTRACTLTFYEQCAGPLTLRVFFSLVFVGLG